MPMAASQLEAELARSVSGRRDRHRGSGRRRRPLPRADHSAAFAGMPRVRQHQLVYAALKGKVGGELHALALETGPPARPDDALSTLRPHRHGRLGAFADA